MEQTGDADDISSPKRHELSSQTASETALDVYPVGGEGDRWTIGRETRSSLSYTKICRNPFQNFTFLL